MSCGECGNKTENEKPQTEMKGKKEKGNCVYKATL